MSRVCLISVDQTPHARMQCSSVLLADAVSAVLRPVAADVARCSSMRVRIQVSRHICRNMERGNARAQHSNRIRQATA